MRSFHSGLKRNTLHAIQGGNKFFAHTFSASRDTLIESFFKLVLDVGAGVFKRLRYLRAEFDGGYGGTTDSSEAKPPEQAAAGNALFLLASWSGLKLVFLVLVIFGCVAAASTVRGMVPRAGSTRDRGSCCQRLRVAQALVKWVFLLVLVADIRVDILRLPLDKLFLVDAFGFGQPSRSRRGKGGRRWRRGMGLKHTTSLLALRVATTSQIAVAIKCGVFLFFKLVLVWLVGVQIRLTHLCFRLGLSLFRL